MTDIVNGLLLRDGQVLLAHRAPHRRNYPNSWSFPGGHVETGETLGQALVRELQEEIGVTPTRWSFLRRFDDARDGEGAVTFHLYAVQAWDGAATNLGDEHDEIRWIPMVDASQMSGLTFPVYGDVFRALAGL